jgi:hypothetical protein
MRAQPGAHVGDEPVDQGHDPPVAVEPDLRVVPLLARVIRRHEMLAPILDPLHRPREAHRGPRDQQVFGVELAPHAEPAAHLQLDEVDQVLGMAQEVGQHAPVEMRELGDPPQSQQARAGVERRRQAAGLQRDAGVSLDDEMLAHARVGRGHGGGRIALARLEPVHHVSAQDVVEHGRVVPDGPARVGDGGQGLVADLEQVDGILGDVPAVGDHEGDRLSHVADAVPGERPLQAGGVADPVPGPCRNTGDVAEVGGGHDGHDPRKVERAVGVDGAEPRVGVRGPEDGGVEHAGEPEVGRVRAAAHQQATVLLARHGASDRRGHRHQADVAVARDRAAARAAANQTSSTSSGRILRMFASPLTAGA